MDTFLLLFHEAMVSGHDVCAQYDQVALSGKFFHSRFSQTLHFLFFRDLSLRRNELHSLFIHRTLELKKMMPFQLRLFILFFYFFLKAVFELKNPGCRFLLCLFFFDSLSCLVSPHFFIFSLSAVRMTDWERDARLLLLAAVRKQLTHCCQAQGTLGDESDFTQKFVGDKRWWKKHKASHNQADEPVRSGTSRNATRHPKGEYSHRSALGMVLSSSKYTTGFGFRKNFILFLYFKKLEILFSKDALNWSKLIVKNFTFIQKKAFMNDFWRIMWY